MPITEVKVEDIMLLRARDKAAAMGQLNNSITRGQGNLAGFIGEEIASKVLGAEPNNTFDYDVLMPDGTRIDVKTKRTSVPPLPTYECSISAINTNQKCDYYAFVRVHNDFHVGWFLGVYPKADYFLDATFYKKGMVDPSNGFTFKADCYNLAIKDLKAGL